MDEHDIRIYTNRERALVDPMSERGNEWVRNNMVARGRSRMVNVSAEEVSALQAQMEQAGLTVSVR